MSKVITFSRFFPKDHPKAGQATHFVEKIWRCISVEMNQPQNAFFYSKGLDAQRACFYRHIYKPKYHTIRSGFNWKVGDKFSPRVWSGKPYQSKQIIIAEDLTVASVFEIELTHNTDHNGKQYRCIFIDGHNYGNLCELNQPLEESEYVKAIAQNDGLDVDDFLAWFKADTESFHGQMICWFPTLRYS